jgi:hypothetical protein
LFAPGVCPSRTARIRSDRTAVTEAKLKELHEALPWFTIRWDGGKMEPE